MGQNKDRNVSLPFKEDACKVALRFLIQVGTFIQFSQPFLFDFSFFFPFAFLSFPPSFSFRPDDYD